MPIPIRSHARSAYFGIIGIRRSASRSSSSYPGKRQSSAGMAIGLLSSRCARKACWLCWPAGSQWTRNFRRSKTCRPSRRTCFDRPIYARYYHPQRLDQESSGLGSPTHRGGGRRRHLHQHRRRRRIALRLCSEGSPALLKRAEALLAEIPVLAIEARVDAEYGGIRAELEAAGRPIGHNDLWIAAHAYTLGATIVTDNEREFRRIRGLQVENWLA